MQIFINIFFMALSWAAGIFVFTIVMEKIKNYKQSHAIQDILAAAGLVAVLIVTLVVVGLLNNGQGAAFMAGGYVVSFVNVVDPIRLTQARADAIGREAERKAAIKQQAEEQKREDERIKKENARIYAEEKKKNAAK